MSDYGALVLPDHDLTAADFKELARRIGRAAFVPLFLKYYERVMTSEATVEEQRRALADIARWVGVEEEKKTDPNANLPVFNIVFGAPSAHGATSMQVVEMIQPEPKLPAEPLAGSLAGALDPEEIEIIHKLMEPPHAQQRPAQPASAHEGTLGADAPRERRDDSHPPERPQALRDAVRPAPGVPPEDGEPLVSEQEAQIEQMSMDDHLADLDRVLGL
jgi:hypothetical protein